MDAIVSKLELGISQLKVGEQYKKTALENLKRWLEEKEFAEYQQQLHALIENGRFELLLDSFYQVIPFGTAGRRGPVGIGPNRINPWTIQASAQGHSNYLLDKFGADAKKRGLVICYDVRKYPDTKLYAADLPNPIGGISSKDLALYAALVYAANDIKCYMFDSCRSTPELSFAIRHLHAVSGIVISASHNPKEDNGKKVYSSDGGQLLPPEDQRLSDTVNKVKEIKRISKEDAKSKGLLEEIGDKVDKAYIKAVTSQALAGNTIDKSNLTVVYSPLHGVGITSAYQVMLQNGFKVVLDEKTASLDGAFPNVKFNIPNPEVVESMETMITKGKEVDADILINTDPDADRLGLMAKISGTGKDATYRYFSGNEIGIVLSHYVLEERKRHNKLPGNGILVKTTVTSELIAKIAHSYGIQIIGDLLVGFKYIAGEIKKLQDRHEEKRFLLGMEESHGFLVGTYARDKDAAGAALLLCELAAELKAEGKNIAGYLDGIYTKFGYHSHEQTSLIFLGAEGKEKIDKITASLRQNPPNTLGKWKITRVIDRWQGAPISSETDRSSRNVLTFDIEPSQGVDFIKITVRPSGTEPKVKIYIEVGGKPLAGTQNLADEKQLLSRLTTEVIDSFTRMSYQCVGIDMPDRGFRLSNLLPVEIKLKYFGVETELLELEQKVAAGTMSQDDVKKRVDELFKIFGKDPVEKISAAFQEKTGMRLRKFLDEKLKPAPAQPSSVIPAGNDQPGSDADRNNPR